LGSAGTSQIILAVVEVTSGKDTFDGAPGTVNYKMIYFKIVFT